MTRVVVLAPHVPGPAVPHAGGQYLLAHVQALVALGAEVVVLAPSTPANRAAVCPVPVQLLDTHRWQSGAGHLVGTAGRALRPWTPGAGLRRALRRGAGPLLAGADAVEVHWPELLGLLPTVAALTPAPVVVVPHDVLSHRLAGTAAAPGTRVRRVHARAVAGRVARAEARLYPQAAAVGVFTAGDADRVAARGARRTVVLPPPLTAPALLGPATRPQVLFAAALDRRVNDDAACWLVELIWPLVLRERPDADLVVLGAGPSDRLRALASAASRVLVTGRVPALAPWYAASAAVVAPLRAGAGVKFKCLDAVLHGLPLVGTTVAAEGLPAHWFAAVTDDAAALAAAVVAALDPTPADTARTRSAAREAATTHSPAAHRAAVARLHPDVLGGPAMTVPAAPGVSR